MTALKTLSLRIRSATAKLEDEGLDMEGMVESTADLRKLVMAATGVDILEKDQKTFKSTYEILLGISKVWQDIDDTTRSALLQKLAGKQQANVVASILNNSELLEQVYKETANSAGVALKEQAKWANSIEAKYSKIEAIFESMSTHIFNSDSFKRILDGLANIMEFVDKLISKGNGLTLLATALGGVMGGLGVGIIDKKSMSDNFKILGNYNTALKNGKQAAKDYADTLKTTNPAMANYLGNLNGAKGSMKGFTEATIRQTMVQAGLNAVLTISNALMNAAIGLIVSGIITGIGKLIRLNDDLTKSFGETVSKSKEGLKTLDDYKESINKIVESDQSEAEKLKELGEIKDEISTKYKTEIDDINNVTSAREKLLEVLEKERLAELEKHYREGQDDFRKYSSNLVAGSGGYDSGGGMQASISTLEDIGNDIQKLFSQFETSSNGRTLFFNIDFGNDVEEYYNNMVQVANKIAEIRQLRGDNWTQSEEALYDALNKQIKTLEDLYYGDNNRVESVLSDAAQYAELIKLLHPREQGQSLEEWRASLYAAADADTKYGEGVYWVKKAIDELVDSIAKMPEALSETNPELSFMYSNLEKVRNGCELISKEIEEADKAFDKLNKTMEDNADADKFFSSSDIIELLELYPELSDAVLESSYGYKIEEEAIKNLHDTKLAEKKADLQNQLDEKQTLLDAVQHKLGLYASEIGGVKDLATAKAKLIELEAIYASLGANTTNPYYNNGALEKQIALLNDYITLSEELDELQGDVHQLSIEEEVLGKSHSKAKDAAQDQTKALNNQKDAIKELNDAMNDGQKAIEDLIKLTMDMIKKNKNLEKEALKEQLENYKKLADKQKELIDLKKEERDFNKDLADQNRDLLAIQQELEALSIEGANYSLEDMKRKAELQQKYNEQNQKRTDFLYDHEVDVRKDAIDKETEAFEDQIDTQVKAIEDYLDHEGKIRQDAINLINGKTQQFYDDLLSYTMNYTDKSRYEFDKLWTEAYNAIYKYAGGMLDVDLALANIMQSMAQADAQLKAIEASINNIKNATDAAKDAAIEWNKVLSNTQSNYVYDKYSAPIGAGLPNSPLYQETQDFLAEAMKKKNNTIRRYHSGGIVEGVSNEHGEVLAKLLSGEVVVTENQARNFMQNTLPKLATTTTTNNASIAPVINMGDIVINGNADQTAIDKIKSIQNSIVEDVFSKINNSTRLFSGGKLRPI